MYFQGTYFSEAAQDHNYSHLIFVEGRDDGMFLDEILKKRTVDPRKVRVNICGGKQRLPETLSLLTKSTAYLDGVVRSVAIIFDSDSNPEASYVAIEKALRSAGLAAPGNGIVVPSSPVNVGVFTLPGPNQSGDLEELAWLLSASPINSLTEAFLSEVQAETAVLDQLSKRRIQAYLAAASVRIRNSVGWAFYDGLLAVDTTTLADIFQFIDTFLDSGS